jgi:lysophospholipase L1-like esterase
MNKKLLALPLLLLLGCAQENGNVVAPATSSSSDGTLSQSSSDGTLPGSSSDGTTVGSSSSTAVELSTCTASLTAGWQTCAANDSKIRIIARADLTDPTRPTFSWSGSAVQFSFTGTAAKIHLYANGSVFNVFIDGNDSLPTNVLDLTNSADTLHVVAEGLTPGSHQITVYKRTEAQYGEAVFSGIEVQGTLDPLPAAKTRRIEFIGNSITCGYGNLVDDPTHIYSWDILTEDHSITYAALTARTLNAEEHAVCVSGRGIFRNNDNSEEGTLPTLYPLTSYTSTVTWDFSRWTADVVVVNLGTNDFYKGIPDSTLFVNASVAFVKDIRTQYPLAQIIMVDGPMLSDYFPNASAEDMAALPAEYFKLGTNGVYTFKSQTVCKRFLTAAQASLIAQGYTGIERLSIPAQSAQLSFGADWHPSKKQHALMARLLTEKIQGLTGW